MVQVDWRCAKLPKVVGENEWKINFSYGIDSLSQFVNEVYLAFCSYSLL